MTSTCVCIVGSPGCAVTVAVTDHDNASPERRATAPGTCGERSGRASPPSPIPAGWAMSISTTPVRRVRRERRIVCGARSKCSSATHLTKGDLNEKDQDFRAHLDGWRDLAWRASRRERFCEWRLDDTVSDGGRGRGACREIWPGLRSLAWAAHVRSVGRVLAEGRGRSVRGQPECGDEIRRDA